MRGIFRLSALYSEFGRLHGKPLAGEKTPDYVRRLPLLHAVFPWVRTVHIIRDGRDVALSTLEWASEDKGPGKLELLIDGAVRLVGLQPDDMTSIVDAAGKYQLDFDDAYQYAASGQCFDGPPPV